MTRIPITDPQDPRLADYRSLKDSELRKRYENEAGVFIAEGPNPVRELLASRYPVRSLLLSPDRADELAPLLPSEDVDVYVADTDMLREIVRFPLHQGAIAVGGRLPDRTVADVLGGARMVAVLEEMNDHENMGSLFRSARALGCDGVLIGPRSADPLYRRCVRVSMGHVLHVPHAPIGDLPTNLGSLTAAGFTTVALSPDLSVRPLGALRPEGPVALLLGAEGEGLAADTMAAADIRARIPLADEVDSLNVSVAAAIAFHTLGPLGTRPR